MPMTAPVPLPAQIPTKVSTDLAHEKLAVPTAGGVVCIPYNAQVGFVHFISPGGCNLPLMMNLHGGGWVAGQASDMDAFAGAEVFSGIVYATIDYTDGAPMSVILAQVHLAFSWIQANAGLLSIDPNRIGILGFSAGGHLALMEAMTNHATRWVGSLSGPTDMTALFWFVWNNAFAFGLGSQLGQAEAQIIGDIQQVMGGNPLQQPGEYAAYSPVNDYHGLIGSGANTSFYIAQAVDDAIVPAVNTQDFANQLTSHGASVFYRSITGGHLATVYQGLEAINNFLTSTPSSFH
jgi:acetyl esterase/lipase